MYLELEPIEKRFHKYKDRIEIYDKAFQLWLQDQGILESVDFKDPSWNQAFDRTLQLRMSRVGKTSDALFLMLMSMPGMFVSNQRLAYGLWGHKAGEDNEFNYLNQSFYGIATDLPKVSLHDGGGLRFGSGNGGKGIGIRSYCTPFIGMVILHEHWRIDDGLIKPDQIKSGLRLAGYNSEGKTVAGLYDHLRASLSKIGKRDLIPRWTGRPYFVDVRSTPEQTPQT